MKEGIAKLKKLGGTCSAEPDTCTRMFCGDETGIYLCNNVSLNQILLLHSILFAGRNNLDIYMKEKKHADEEK